MVLMRDVALDYGAERLDSLQNRKVFEGRS